MSPSGHTEPKIHKKDTPNSLDDSIGSVTYNLSKAVVEIINPPPWYNRTPLQEKQLAQELNHTCITVEKHDIFVSHNVVSLFTKTPADVTRHVSMSRMTFSTLLHFFHLFSVQRHHVQTDRRLHDGRSTIHSKEQFFHGGPGNRSHPHSTHAVNPHFGIEM